LLGTTGAVPCPKPLKEDLLGYIGQMRNSSL